MEESRSCERNLLLTQLLDIVKQCQLKFESKSNLATENDERVKMLCLLFENVLHHGLKETFVMQSSLKQLKDIAGISKLTSILLPVENVRNTPKQTCWNLVKAHLSQHELERFNTLKNISSDLGRTRAWFRAALNEHSLERYLHSIVNDELHLINNYESWSFMRDDEKVVTLPNMAGGLSTILFALNIDKNEFNSVPEAANNSNNYSDMPVAVENFSTNICDVRLKRKKRQAKVISFDDKDFNETSQVPIESLWKNDLVLSQQNQMSHDVNISCSVPQRNSADDFISPNLPSDDRYSDVFLFEDELLSERSFNNMQEFYETSHVSLSKSESNLKEMSQIESDKVSRHSSFTNRSSRTAENSGQCLMPLSTNGKLINIGGLQILDPDTTSESYGSFDSQDISLSDILVMKPISQNIDGISSHSQQLDTKRYEENESRAEEYDFRHALTIKKISKRDSLEENSHLKKLFELANKTNADQTKNENHIEDWKEQLNCLQKENVLLKDQLKNYIEALKILEVKKDPCHEEVQSENITQTSDYEQKLIQIAEMHGEMMEFNESIYKKLLQKEAQLRQANQELVMLRRSMGIPNAGRSLHLSDTINIIIPSAFLHGSSSQSYHIYQIYIKIRNEEWNVYRRYTEFFDLHCKLKKYVHGIKDLEFPPKKAFGKKNPKLVEERRRKLETYLREAIGFIIEKYPRLSECPSKQVLISTIPFFNNEARSWNSSAHDSFNISSTLCDVPSSLSNQYSGL